MTKKVLIGTVTLGRDVKMLNTQTSYAADFEELEVAKGTYPVYAYADDLKKVNGKTKLGWRNYIGYEGTSIRGTFGNKPGDHTSYHVMTYDYVLAERFFDGEPHDDSDFRYDLDKAWKLGIHEFESDGTREFMLEIVLKDGAEPTYID